MTRKNFLWCLVKTTGPIRLRWKSIGDVQCAYVAQIHCTAKGMPGRDQNGQGIGAIRENTSVIASHWTQRPESMAKYVRWGAAAGYTMQVLDRFGRVANDT